MRCKNVMQSKNTSIELYKIILNTYLYLIKKFVKYSTHHNVQYGCITR